MIRRRPADGYEGVDVDAGVNGSDATKAAVDVKVEKVEGW